MPDLITLQPLDHAGLAWAQSQVTAHHYLHRPVDSRCSVEGYQVWRATRDGRHIAGPVGLLLFGRPEATRCGNWYGSVDDVSAGRCEVTRWEVLNLARVWLDPRWQDGGPFCQPPDVPGFRDRHGTWHSTLASSMLRSAITRIGYDYLVRRPPVWVQEPYQIRYVLSYCNTRLHRGTIYRASGFELYRTNAAGLQTWRIPLPALTPEQDAHVRTLADQHPRSRAYRARRAAGGLRQLSLVVNV
jgi:hypothetical protein